MSHATALKLDHKQLPDNGPETESAAESQGFAARAALLASSGEAQANDPPQVGPGRESFFRAIGWDSKPTGRDGQPWRVAHQCDGAVAALARADRILAGLDAVLTVLRAADYARSDGCGPGDALGDFLTDELSLAASELSRAASDSLQCFRAIAEKSA